VLLIAATLMDEYGHGLDDDAAELTRMLNEFAGASINDAAAHDRFGQKT
jgi:hypothetical protein